MANNPLPDDQLAELDRLREAALKTTWVMGAAREVFNAYPALRQRLLDAESRLADAERERDEWKSKARITQAKLENMAIDCGQAEGSLRRLREDLAARDAQQRREGAAEWLENAAREGGYYERSSEGMLEEAQRLRERGE